ncbi:MAG: dihydrodipicolinate synthase family protein, partial [Myxococcales bacterium]
MEGVLAPVLTPFGDDLSPDPARFLRLCRSLLDEGLSALALFGTTSEANSLSVEERERLLEAVLESGISAQKLIPGTGCSALPDTIRLSRKAARAGCAGVLMLPPFYYKNLTEEGLFRSFARAIDGAGEPRLRVYLYHIPQVSQVAIPLRVIERLLAAYPGVVVGIKDSSGDFANTEAMLRAFPGFEVFVGTEKFLLRNRRAGGAGCITATANVNASALVRAFRERTEERQREIDAVRATFEKFPLI